MMGKLLWQNDKSADVEAKKTLMKHMSLELLTINDANIKEK